MSGWFAMTMRWLWARGSAATFLLGPCCGLAFCGQTAAGAFEVGQQWVYRHEGPRPGSAEPNAIDGQRILHVVSKAREQSEVTWVIEERFSNDQGVIGRLYVNQMRMLTALDIENDKGEVAPLYYEPPVPYQVVEMGVGQTRTIATTLRVKSAEFALRSTITIQRLEDETITTPAGEFADCLHYQVSSRSTIDLKIAKVPITEERQRWFHPSVNGLIKEVYRREPVKFLTWSRPGYTATSVLTAFGNVPVPADTRGLGAGASAPPTTRGPGNPSPRRSLPPLAYVIGIAVLAVSGLTVRRLARRVRRKPAAS